MPRLKSKNLTDKQIPKGPYWDFLIKRLRDLGVSSTKFNLEIQRETSTRALAAPFYGDLFRVCRLANVRGGDVFGEIGIDLMLSEEDQEFLRLADQIPDEALNKVLYHMQVLDWGWYKGLVDSNVISPYSRLRSYFVHASPPISENQTEYRFKTIAQLIADAKDRGLDEPTTDDLARYYVAKMTSSYNGLAIPIELIPHIAEMCDVSARWLCGYSDQDSFFGFKPLAEQLYDFWKTNNKTNKDLITKTLLKIQERM